MRDVLQSELRRCFNADGTAKRRYSQTKAEEVIRSMRERGAGSTCRPYRAYLCGCGFWHVGRAKPKGQRR